MILKECNSRATGVAIRNQDARQRVFVVPIIV